MARPKGSKNKKKVVETPEAVETVEKVVIVEPEIIVEDDPMLPEKSLFRVDEAASYFNVAARTIYLWVEHGILKAEKYRGTIRISRASILGCRFRARLDPMM